MESKTDSLTPATSEPSATAPVRVQPVCSTTPLQRLKEEREEIIRKWTNKLPAQRHFQCSHDWHVAAEKIIRKACEEYCAFTVSSNNEVSDGGDKTR